MQGKSIKIKDGGIVLDEDKGTVTLYAGKTAIVLDGKNQKIALSGQLSKMNKGDETEEIFLKKTSSITAIIPSTTFTPIPQAIPNIPINEVTGMIKDVLTLVAMYSNLGGK